MAGVKDRCAIVGIGETEFSTNSGRTELSLAAEASLKAIQDAGLSVKDIDGVCKYQQDSTPPDILAYALGIPHLRFYAEITGGGSASCGSVAAGVAAIISGQARNVLCFRGMNGRSGRRFGQGGSAIAHTNIGQFEHPYGIISPGQRFALMAQRHMHEYGTTSAQFGRLAVAMRRNAQRNPRALMRDPLTLEQHQASRIIASPFKLFDCCLETDGGCAVVVSSAEQARTLKQRPAYISGVAMAWGHQAHSAYDSVEDFCSVGAKVIAKSVFEMADCKPTDIKVAEIYDAFTYTALVQLEDYGFCKKGEGGPFVESGAIDYPTGKLPLNTHGGLLSEGYIHAMNTVIEGVRQVRGASTSPVKDVDLAFVCGYSAERCSAMILRR